MGDVFFIKPIPRGIEGEAEEGVTKTNYRSYLNTCATVFWFYLRALLRGTRGAFRVSQGSTPCRVTFSCNISWRRAKAFPRGGFFWQRAVFLAKSSLPRQEKIKQDCSFSSSSALCPVYNPSSSRRGQCVHFVDERAETETFLIVFVFSQPRPS